MSQQKDSLLRSFLDGRSILQIFDLISFLLSNLAILYMINRFILDIDDSQKVSLENKFLENFNVSSKM